MTNDIRRRYLNDPVFHNMVNVLRGAIRELMLTPSEVREAAMLACVIEEERRPFTVTMLDAEMDAMRKPGNPFSGYLPCGCINVQDEQRRCKTHGGTL